MDLWVKSPVDDVMIQATLTEVRPDGNEVLIQSGWLRVGHHGEEGENLRIDRDYSAENFTTVLVDEWQLAQISIPSFAHPVRRGSQVLLSISSPGRNHGTWQFATPEYDSIPEFLVGYGGELASSLRLTILPDIEIPEVYPDCHGLRGQPCREFMPVENTVVD